MSEIGEIIKSEINQSVKNALMELFEPLQVLKGFETVEVLTLDEMVSILRKDKEIIRAACYRGEIPYQPIGRDIIFPKRQVIEFLTGVWQKQQKQNQVSEIDKRAKKLLAFVS